MLVSGAAPWLFLLVGQSWFVLAMEYQFALACLFALYVACGLYWAALEKHYVSSRKGERIRVSIGRAVVLVFAATLIQTFAKGGVAAAEEFAKQIAGLDARHPYPGFLSLLMIWPGAWAIICLYSLKPVWDHAVDAVREVKIIDTFSFAAPKLRAELRGPVTPLSPASDGIPASV